MPLKGISFQCFQDIPPPSFISKPERIWNDEEKEIFREYEEKVKELEEEKEKYRMVKQNKKMNGFVLSIPDQSYWSS